MIGLRHIGITVCDLKKMKLFYEGLGFSGPEPTLEKGEYIDNFYKMKGVEVVTLKMNDASKTGVLLELLQYQTHPSDSSSTKSRSVVLPGISHFALTVEDIDDLYQQLLSKGIEFNCKPQLSPDGKAKVAFCLDPEHNLIELVQVM